MFCVFSNNSFLRRSRSFLQLASTSADEETYEKGYKRMTLLIETIYDFFNNPQNMAEFEEWRERKSHTNENHERIQKAPPKTAAREAN